ncbi:MAG TPA: hypothetical protein H9672_01750, partial [Firmicutes bacterium]|nr:hypothetical protein [Bacillota bacterium]
CICVESFQDAEKDFLRLYGEMGIVLLSSRALCHNIGLISRHYLDHIYIIFRSGSLPAFRCIR